MEHNILFSNPLLIVSLSLYSIVFVLEDHKIVFSGKALLREDNLVLTKTFDQISSLIDGLVECEKIKKFPSPALNVSINVHRHLLEMVRHPGYISTTFEEGRGRLNST